MLVENKKKDYYQALLDKNSDYEGLFFVGIKTTGIFCRPTCTARKPKFENCDFFNEASEALLAGYRPCKRCHPMSFPQQESDLVKKLIKAVEEFPEKKWTDQDFKLLGVDTSTVRRQFKKRFGMTFVAYARARRLGLAFQSIREGNSIIEAQLDAGYDSGSGFRDAFSKIMGTSPYLFKNSVLKAEWIDTKLGPMIAIADDNYLYLLEFADRRGLENEIKTLRKKYPIVPGETKIIKSIRCELELYFEGELTEFKTPVTVNGSDFQKQVWQALLEIPYGTTCSYLDLAKKIKRPKAFRAVGTANGNNILALIVPCHRVINSNGELGGYGGGLKRKELLLKFEKENLLS